MSWFTLCVVRCVYVCCVDRANIGIVLVKYHNKLKSEILGTCMYTKVPVCPS